VKKSRWYAGLIAIGAAGALVLSGCSTGGGNEGSDGGGIITTNGTNPQNALIPTATNEVGGGKILDMMFAGLVYYDADGKPHNDVAKSIDSDDATKYTIKIRDDAKFTDGTPVKAENFVKAWNYGGALDNNQLNSYFFEDIKGFSYDKNVDEMEGLKVVDDTTFTVELKQPTADWPLRMGYSAYYPLPDSAFDDMKAFGKKPIGNGPYKLDELKRDTHAKLVKNEDYNGPRKVKNDGVTVKFYAQIDAAYADLQSDSLDVLDQVPDSAYSNFEDEFKGRSVNEPTAVFQSFTIPSRLDHFDGKEGELRREALSMAIDRDTITDKIFKGTRTPASDFTSPVIDGWKKDIKGSDVLKLNADKAKKLWDEANDMSDWGDTKFEIAYNADDPHQAWVDAVANSLKKNLGIDATGKPVPVFDEFRKDITDRSIESAFRSGWQADYPGMYNFLGPLYGTNAGSNDGDYSNPDFDKLIKEGNAADNPDDAAKKYVESQEILLKDLPAIPLWYDNVTGAWSTQVDNVKFGWNSVPLYYEITKK
jgi:oligopeptide transport system substrate-binding protein